MAKKRKTPELTPDANELGSAISSVARMLADVSNSLDKLDHLSYLETLAENATELGHLKSVAHAIAARTIAEHGSAEDRAKIIEHLKTWFWESDVFRP